MYVVFSNNLNNELWKKKIILLENIQGLLKKYDFWPEKNRLIGWSEILTSWKWSPSGEGGGQISLPVASTHSSQRPTHTHSQRSTLSTLMDPNTPLSATQTFPSQRPKHSPPSDPNTPFPGTRTHCSPSDPHTPLPATHTLLLAGPYMAAAQTSLQKHALDIITILIC